MSAFQFRCRNYEVAHPLASDCPHVPRKYLWNSRGTRGDRNRERNITPNHPHLPWWELVGEARKQRLIFKFHPHGLIFVFYTG
jgi:hypothetical protein